MLATVSNTAISAESDASVIYVDINADEAEADGSLEKPFKTIGEGITLALASTQDKVTINVASGTYEIASPVSIYGKRTEQTIELLGPNSEVPYNGSRSEEAIITYTDEAEKIYSSLFLVYADNVSIKGFSLTNENAPLDQYSNYSEARLSGNNIDFSNNIIISNADKFGVMYENENSSLKQNHGATIRGNYVSMPNLTSYAVYVQGHGATVENNLVENSYSGIQIQPYHNEYDGVVQNNIFKVWGVGVYFNYSKLGAGDWTFLGNEIYPVETTSDYESSIWGKNWQGFVVETFGTEGSGNKLPTFVFNDNLIDATGYFGNDAWKELFGIYFRNNIKLDSTFTIKGNSVKNVHYGVKDGIDSETGYVMTDETINALYDENTYYPCYEVVGTDVKFVAFDVQFVNYDDTQIGERQCVEPNKGAEAPEDPVRNGYTFVGWDKEFDEVVDNLIVTAKYEINTYTVIFKDHDGAELDTQEVEYLGAATAPKDPTLEAYTFVGWDKEFDEVTEDLIVTAVFKKNVYTFI